MKKFCQPKPDEYATEIYLHNTSHGVEVKGRNGTYDVVIGVLTNLGEWTPYMIGHDAATSLGIELSANEVIHATQ